MRASCSICTENFTQENEISAVPCGHTFHDECLRKWLVQSKTCPQCRKTVLMRSVIHKLFFNDGDAEEGDVDVGKLKNELDSLRLNLRQKDKEKAEVEADQDKLRKRISGLQENVNSMQILYQQERSKTDTLRKELSYMRKMQQEADSAKEEATKLRDKLRGLKNVQDLVNGMASDIEDKVRNSSIQDLAKWCVVQEKELRRKKLDCKKLQEELQNKNKEHARLKRLLDERTKQCAITDEKLNISEQDVTSLEKQNISLKKKLQALQNSIDSPSNTSIGTSLAHRLINESPAPFQPPNKRPRLSEPAPGFDIDLDVSSELFSSPPSSQNTPNTQLKNNCKEYGTKFVKITSAASSSRPGKEVKEIGNLPGLGNLNILRKTIGNSSMLKQQSSIFQKGYNGLGGHDNFIQPRGHPFGSKKMKKSTSASAIVKTNPFKIPPLPSMENM